MSSQTDSVIKIRKEWESLVNRHEKDTNTSSLLQKIDTDLKRGNFLDAEKTWQVFVATDKGRTVRRGLLSDLAETYSTKRASSSDEVLKPVDEGKDEKKTGKKEPPSGLPPSSAEDVIQEITTKKRREEDTKTQERIESEKKELTRKPEETKDKLFNESIKKLNKELLYNIKFRKQVPSNLLSRSIKRTVVEHYVDQEGDEYRQCEKNVFDNWCKQHGTTDKKDPEFRGEVDKTFLSEKKPELLSLSQELEQKKNEVRLVPKADFFVEHILFPVINNFLYQDSDEEDEKKEEKQTNRRKGLHPKQYPKRYFINKADKRRIIQFLVLIFSVKLNTYKNQVVGLAPLLIGHESFLETPGQETVRTGGFYAPSSQYSSSPDYYSGGGENRSPRNYWQGPYRQPNFLDKANNLFSRARNIGRPSPRSGTNPVSRSLTRKVAKNILRGMRLISPVANPATMVIILVALLVLFFLIQGTIGPGGILDEQATTAGSSISLTKTANVDQIESAGQITYTINVNYANWSGPIAITDPIPNNAEYVSCSDNCVIKGDANGNLVAEWTINPTNTQTTTSSNTTQETSSFNYAEYGFPAPQNPNPVLNTSYYQNWLDQWNTYMSPQVAKVLSLPEFSQTKVEAGMLGGWFLHEQNPNTFYDNCNDKPTNPNTPCYSNNWQVGYGVRPMETEQFLENAIKAMHPDKEPSQIIQDVIAASKARGGEYAITTNISIPEGITTSDIVQGAEKGDGNSRLLIGILMKDDAIGTYILTKVLEWYAGPNMAKDFDSWPGNFHNPQDVSNSFSAAYMSAQNLGGGTYSGSNSFTITLKPKNGVNNTYIINQAFASSTKSNCSVVKIGNPQKEVVLPTTCTLSEYESVAGCGPAQKGSLSTGQIKEIFGSPGSPTSGCTCSKPSTWYEENIVTAQFLGKTVEIHKKIKHCLENAGKQIQESTDPAVKNFNAYDIQTYCHRYMNILNSCKSYTGSEKYWSKHGFGIAIDINPNDNPYIRKSEKHTGDHTIPDGFAAIMKANGFRWGGDWINPDYMHFEWAGPVN